MYPLFRIIICNIAFALVIAQSKSPAGKIPRGDKGDPMTLSSYLPDYQRGQNHMLYY